jgi:hypothetical protein
MRNANDGQSLEIDKACGYHIPPSDEIECEPHSFKIQDRNRSMINIFRSFDI